MPTLDTDVIVDLLRGHERSRSAVARMVSDANALFIAPHTLFELYRGAFSRSAPSEELERVESFRAGLVVLPFDERVSREAALIFEDLRSAGTPIPERDIFIGASSIVWGDGKILTNDEGHFGLLEPFGLSVLRP
jgi:predicted nucleic acid-binding protein